MSILSKGILLHMAMTQQYIKGDGNTSLLYITLKIVFHTVYYFNEPDT